jgi:hypothetical protein
MTVGKTASFWAEIQTLPLKLFFSHTFYLSHASDAPDSSRVQHILSWGLSSGWTHLCNSIIGVKILSVVLVYVSLFPVPPIVKYLVDVAVCMACVKVVCIYQVTKVHTIAHIHKDILQHVTCEKLSSSILHQNLIFLNPGLWSGNSPKRFKTKTEYVFLPFLYVCYLYSPSHYSLFILPVLAEEHKLWTSSLCDFLQPYC